MRRAVKFLAAAEIEADEGVAWYEERESGLGTKFRESVESTILSIIDNPFAHPIVEGSRVRRALVDRFPYIVVYTFEIGFHPYSLCFPYQPESINMARSNRLTI